MAGAQPRNGCPGKRRHGRARGVRRTSSPSCATLPCTGGHTNAVRQTRRCVCREGARHSRRDHAPLGGHTIAQAYQTIRMERRNGIPQMTLHTNGGVLQWGELPHRESPQAFRDIGSDPDNKVVILTGTGEAFSGPRATPYSQKTWTQFCCRSYAPVLFPSLACMWSTPSRILNRS